MFDHFVELALKGLTKVQNSNLKQFRMWKNDKGEWRLCRLTFKLFVESFDIYQGKEMSSNTNNLKLRVFKKRQKVILTHNHE